MINLLMLVIMLLLLTLIRFNLLLLISGIERSTVGIQVSFLSFPFSLFFFSLSKKLTSFFRVAWRFEGGPCQAYV